MPEETAVADRHRGLPVLLLAFAVWGLFPVYWKYLGEVPALPLLLLRLVLTSVLCLLLLPLFRQWKTFRETFRCGRVLSLNLAAALFLSANWFSFIWAVGNGRILESSLGYFLCPLVSVLLGWLVEKERLPSLRGLAVVCAACGVAIIIFLAGRLPLAALAIAGSWGFYSLFKKRNPLPPLVSLGLESSLLAPFALLALFTIPTARFPEPTALTPVVQALLPFLGAVTALPLLLFAYALPRVPLSTVGMGQYIVPSAHFGLALLFGERLPLAVLGGFAFIWVGLVLFAFGARQLKN
ncbi:MAG: EamA family transporter RarD [Verrucomicrobia bacterium]|jgi:chloramphenicol-sensitive protein RarD|nr:EamA family transporter RarD [Verrucomicrobiota bacterium]